MARNNTRTTTQTDAEPKRADFPVTFADLLASAPFFAAHDPGARGDNSLRYFTAEDASERTVMGYAAYLIETTGQDVIVGKFETLTRDGDHWLVQAYGTSAYMLDTGFKLAITPLVSALAAD